MSNIEYSAVNAKGQVVIPADIRERLDIKQGTKIAFVEEQGRLFLQPVTDAFIESMRGSLAKRGMPAKLEHALDREFA
jgi:AbrB family looped-hinge helix DNA binding protein